MKIMKDFVLPSLVLTLICLVVSAALVFTYQFTTPYIEEAAKREADAARMELLPKADGFSPVELEEIESVTEIYKANNGEGYVIAATSKGFGGVMNVMVGIDKDGKISGVKLMENAETAGLGSNVGEPAFTSQFIGKDSDLQGVEKISGASISSAAFQTAVQNAYKGYAAATGTGEEQVDPKTELFPNVSQFTPIQVDGAQEAYQAGEEGLLIVTQGEGYNGPITVMTAFDLKGSILGIRVTEHKETPGVGTKAMDEAFTSQFTGKTDTAGIQTVSGATFSSKGVLEAVNQATALFEKAKEALK